MLAARPAPPRALVASPVTAGIHVLFEPSRSNVDEYQVDAVPLSPRSNKTARTLLGSFERETTLRDLVPGELYNVSVLAWMNSVPSHPVYSTARIGNI